MINNLYWSSCKVPFILVRLKMNFPKKFSKNTQIPNFMKIRLGGAELSQAGKHDEASSRLSQFCERA
jgi:hypothetical protein